MNSFLSEEIVNRREQKSVTKEGADSNELSYSKGSSSEEQEDNDVVKEATVATSNPMEHSASMACSSTIDEFGDTASMYGKNEYVRRPAGINGCNIATDDLDIKEKNGNADNTGTEEVEK